MKDGDGVKPYQRVWPCAGYGYRLKGFFAVSGGSSGFVGVATGLPGKDCPQQAGLDEIAAATLRCLRRTVPAAVPGIVFLSGGQKDVAATERLNAICRVGGAPWRLSFSFGRALQDSALKTWEGRPANVAAAQAALQHRARCNGLAVEGEYSAEEEMATA